MTNTNPTIAPLYGGHTKTTQTVEASDHPTIRDRSAKQLTFGPSEAVKQKPTIARLRDVLDDFNIRGTRRLVAYELLTYWQPGGTVFPSIATLADGLGLKARRARHHVAGLHRTGLWVRLERTGQTNIYDLRLPGLSGPVGAVVRGRGGRSSGTGGGGRQDPPEVTNEVTNVQLDTAAAVIRTPPPNDDHQQQQQPNYRYEERGRNDTRYEGLVSVCAAKSRELGRPFDESDARQRLTVDDLQQLADEIQHEIAIVDEDSATRRMKDSEQVDEQAKAIADEKAQARKQAAADEQAAIKAWDAKKKAELPLIKKHMADMREIAHRAKKKYPAVKSDRYRRSSGTDATA